MPLAFSSVDWWIVGVYMLIATLPGFFCRKYIKGQEDFLIAGRTLNIWLATATLTATEMGLITVMYMAEMGFTNGFSAMIVGVIALCATMFVGVTGFMVAGLRRSGVTTLAEYYEKRYSRGVRVLGGLIIATAGILNYGVFLRVEANFVRIITGVPNMVASVDNPDGNWKLTVTRAAGDADFGSIGRAPAGGEAVPASHSGTIYRVSSIKLVMSVLVAVVLLYVLLGGMVSVVLTDYIQFIVLTAGIGATTWWVLKQPDVGGLAGMIEAVRQHRPGYGLDPRLTQEITTGAGLKELVGFGWIWIIWQCMHWTGSNTWQTQAFRTAATDSPRTAKIMWMMTAINYFGRAVIPMLWGVAAIAYLSRTLAPQAFAKVGSLDGMPMLLMALPKGLVGFMLAGMLAALMSTHSSYMLAWSGVITEDLVVPVFRAVGITIPSWSRIWITRCFILCLGMFLIWFGLWYEFKQSVWGYLSMTGTMYVAGSAALLAMGLYWRRASTAGAYLGLLGGAAPGVIYLAARFGVLWFKNGGGAAPAWLTSINDFMTDPVTGIISFPLGFLGMIAGSLLLGGGGRGSEETRPRELPLDDQLALAGGMGGDQ